MINEKPTSANLHFLLTQCADAAPTSFRDQRQAWGFTSASNLLREAGAQGLGAEAARALQEMLHSRDADQVLLALTFIPLADLPAAGIDRVDPSGLHDDAAEELRVKLGFLVSGGRLPYTSSMRAELGLPGGRAFIGAVVAFDHLWFWQNIQTVLGSVAGKAAFDLAFALPHLSREEIGILRDELNRNTARLAADTVAGLVEKVARHLATGSTTEIGPPRFQPL